LNFNSVATHHAQSLDKYGSIISLLKKREP
jgi:hypothetical protein